MAATTSSRGGDSRSNSSAIIGGVRPQATALDRTDVSSSVMARLISRS